MISSKTILAVFSIGVLAATVSSSHAEAEAAVPLIETAPTGWDFAGKEWEGALKIDAFFKPGAFRLMGKSFSTEPEVKTELYLLRTDEALYLGAICYDQDGVSRKGSPSPEEGGLPDGNRLEIYLDGDQGNRQAYYQMIVNPAGWIWLSKAGESISAEQWSGEVQSGEEAWKVRVRIPYSSIGIDPRTTELLHANFFRDYHPVDNREERQYSTWKGAAIGSFHSLKPLLLAPPVEP